MPQFTDYHSGAFPLSQSQLNIWRLEKAYDQTPLNNICCVLNVTGMVDLAALRNAAERAILDAPACRLRVFEQNGVPMQYENTDALIDIPIYDFQASVDGAAKWALAMASSPIKTLDAPLFRAAVFRSSARCGGVLFCAHHLISDAWSQGLFMRAIAENYQHLLHGGACEKKQAPSYRAHVEDELAYLSSPRFEADQAYWRNQIEGLHITQRAQAGVSPVGRRLSLETPALLNRLLSVYCEKERISPFLLFLAALLIYEKRVRGVEMPCIGVPVLGRRTAEEKKTPGMFVQTLPLSAEIPRDMPFGQFLAVLNEKWYELLRHERCPYSALDKMTGGGRLFDVALSFQAGTTATGNDVSAAFEGRWYYSGYQAEKVCVHISTNGENLHVDLDYLTQYYDEMRADCFARSLFSILRNALENPATPVGSLELMEAPEVEKAFLLAGKPDNSAVSFPSPADMLLSAAQTYPERVAIIDNNQRTTYRTLAENARKMAEQIETLTPGKNSVLSIEMPRGAGLMTAVCAALLSHTAFMLPDMKQPAARLNDIRKRAQVALAVDERGVRPFGEAQPPAQAGRGRIAYLVATSGSSGEPKLVEVGEDALANFAAQMGTFYGRSAVLSLCSVMFDAFMIESVCALLNARTIVIAKDSEMNDPEALGRLMRAYDAGFLAMTPSRMTAYLENETFRNALFHAESLVLGGERFPETLLQKLKKLTNARIYNQYGPSEATVCVSAALLNGADEVTCGRALPGCRVYILDEALRPVPQGTVGEICISGVCLAGGYRGDEAATGAAFVSAPFEDRLYRTGDMGLMNRSGELVCMGRRDGQVKLGGRRVELGEIEACLRRLPSVTDACVLLTNQGLTAYLASPGEVDESAARSFVLSALPAYMTPSFYVTLPVFPVTANGKVDKRALPLPVQKNAGGEAQSDNERRMLAIFRETLSNEALGVTDDYFLSGGDSLGALRLLSRVHEAFGVLAPVSALYANGSARALCRLITGQETSPVPLTPRLPCRAPDMADYPLSPAQEHFYALMMLDGGVAYNMPGAFLIEGELDENRLWDAFHQLIMRDEQFRVSFVRRGMAVRAVYAEQAAFVPDDVQGEKTWQDAFRAFVRPFDLSRAPLLRAACYHGGDGVKMLFIDMPHVVSDGVSGSLLMERLNALYAGKVPEEPSIRYRDYAVEAAAGVADEKAVAYWTQALRDFPPPLELPFDYADTHEKTGAAVSFELSEELTQKAEKLAAASDATPFSVFCAVYMTLLSMLTGTRDICVGTPVVGRSGELMRVTGPFVETLPLRAQISDDFALSIKAVCAAGAGMIDHMGVRPAALMRLAGRVSDAPLYEALFSLLPASPSEFALGSARLVRQPFDTGAFKSPLALEISREKDGCLCELAYDAARFDENTAGFISRAYQALLENALRQPEQKITMRDALPAADRVRLFTRPLRRRAPCDMTTLFERIAENAILTPRTDAIVTTRGGMTYEELVKRARSLGAHLIAEGAQPGEAVAVLARRDINLLPTLLGVWAAGCAYLPLDPAFPRERMRVMLERANVRLMLVSDEENVPDGLPPRIIKARFDAPDAPLPPAEPEAPAYVLFTSGSTGEPKGVVVPHRALSNLACEADRLLGDGGTVLCATSAVFDVFVTETWLPLSLGRTVVMADESQMLLPAQMAALMETLHVNVIQLTPSRMRLCLSSKVFREGLAKVGRVLLIGEELTLSLKNAITKCTAARVINQYGPTEATVLCSFKDVTDETKRITIGWPDANCRFYALDKQGNQVLPCAAGELYIAGPCLALEYIGRADLTAAAFVSDPFVPGEKMYRAGDMVRLLPSGEWAYMGRRDGQVKLDGHRIELSELESAALESGLALEAAAVAVVKDGEVRSLRLFVIPGPTYQESAMKDALREKLAAYMMPSRIVTLNTLPRTVSGKTDKKALEAMNVDDMAQKAPVARTLSGNDSSAQTTPDKDWMKALWRDALKIVDCGEDDDFFALGGTSLSALMVISAYFERGKRITIEQFYHAPTLREQRVLLSEKPALQAPHISVAQPAAPAAPALPRYAPEKKNPALKRGDVLLTGASGYLGAHVLRELLAAGRYVVCLARNENKLRDAMNAYFGSQILGLRVIRGDVTAPRFGMTFREYADLALRTGLVVHCAADVRHYAPDNAIEITNVSGTRHALDFCMDAEATLCHVSTASIAGRHAPSPAVFTERDVYLGQDGMENAYIASKMHAEALVIEAMERGMPAQIMRVGRLCARAADGMFQLNASTNAFCLIVRGLMKLGAVPETMLDAAFDLTPVDACAKALVAALSQEKAVFHLVSPQKITLRDIAGALSLQSVSDERFSQLLSKAIQAERSPELSALTDIVTGAGEAQNVSLSLDATLESLARAGFSWPAVPVDRLLCGMKGGA